MYLRINNFLEDFDDTPRLVFFHKVLFIFHFKTYRNVSI